MFWPPYMRRPTTRFANCTGILRCPDSTNTMPTIIATPMPSTVKNWILVPSDQMAPPWAGRRDTTDAKIRIDMPLPMPRWVMSSASHITIAVPAVHVRTIERGAGALKPGMRSLPWKPAKPSRPPLPWCRANTKPVDWMTASMIVT